jgi:hypothetical protein
MNKTLILGENTWDNDFFGHKSACKEKYFSQEWTPV